MSGPRPWESLAGLNGSAEACTCSDEQLANVGCDCPAEQNLPVQCSCGQWLRTSAEIADKSCRSCALRGDDFHDDRPQDHAEWLGPEFADEISLEERWAHYAFEERNGMPYGSSF